MRKYWKTIAGAVCGGGAAALAVFVSPAVGIAAAAVCGAAFGQHASTIGQQLVAAVLGTLDPNVRAELADKATKKGKR